MKTVEKAILDCHTKYPRENLGVFEELAVEVVKIVSGQCAGKLEQRAARLKTPPITSYATPVARELLDQAAEIRHFQGNYARNLAEKGVFGLERQ